MVIIMKKSIKKILNLYKEKKNKKNKDFFDSIFIIEKDNILKNVEDIFFENQKNLERYKQDIEKSINFYKQDIEKSINVYKQDIEKNINIYKQDIEKSISATNSNLSYENQNQINQIENLKDNFMFEKNKISYSKGDKIRLIFLFQIESFWPSWESLYEKIKNNDLFEYKFLFIEGEKDYSQMKNSENFLKQNNIKYEYAKIEKIREFRPHIAIVQTPYDNWHRDKFFFPES